LEKPYPQVSPEIQHEKQAVAGNFSGQRVLKFDSTEITHFLTQYPTFNEYQNDIEKFYRKRDFTYAWYDQKGLIEQAGSLYNRIAHIHKEGITTPLPYADNFTAMMNDNDSLLHREPMNAQAELMLTSQYFSFARHVWQGAQQTDNDKMDWFLVRKKLNLEDLMDSLLLHPEKSLSTEEPVYRQYALLRAYLKKYSDLDSVGKWFAVRPSAKRLKVGDTDPTIADIRKRLDLTGDYVGDTSSLTYTPELMTAIKRFQESRGMSADGIVGPSVIEALNMTPSQIEKKIILNMERSRWVPVSMTGEYIVVNIPAFKLYVYDHDSVVWDMNVVTGQPMHETVVFNGDLKYVVFSPYWNVPQSIYQKEILPGMKRDPNYLTKHNMEMHNGTVRQKPGPNNSLGRVKFLFPNSYNIYLHDTPAKSLFSKDSRAFSHGCIRLGEPQKLAEYLLRNTSAWPKNKIAAAMKSTTEKWVTLDKPVPVFIAYFTAWVGRNGELHLRPDVYSRDERLSEMMIAKN